MPQVQLKAINTIKARKIFNAAGLQAESRKQMNNYLKRVRDKLILNYNDADVTPTGARYEGRENVRRRREWVRGVGDKRNKSENMRGSWHIDVNHDGSLGTLFNTASYAVYVQGPRGHGRGPGQRQAKKMRDRGWRSITDVARETYKEFTIVMNRAYGPSAFDEID